MKAGNGAIKVVHICTVDISLHYMLLNQMLSIREAGYDVSGISAPGPEIAAVQRAGIPYFPVNMTRSLTPLADLKALWQLYRILRRERFTIVHTHTPKAGLLGRLAARMAGTPIVINTAHGFYFHDHMPAFWRRFYIATETIAALCSDIIFSQNQADIQTAIREKISPARKLKYLGNGFDIQSFEQADLREETLNRKRAELGLDPSAPVIGFVGRLVAEKGILELLEAGREIVRHYPAARFLIVGPLDPDKEDALTPAVAAQYGLSEHCVFTGRRSDMAHMYALMDVLALPSHREGFPRTPMEASLMGVPSVVTDIRGCREAVEHERNGLLVPFGDVPALAQAVLRVLGDRELARRLGETGRQMARERFDERRVFQTIIDEYARLLHEKGFAAQVPALVPRPAAPPTAAPQTAARPVLSPIPLTAPARPQSADVRPELDRLVEDSEI